MSATHVPTQPRPGARFLRTATLVVGATFLLVGVLGFVPGIVTDHDQLEMAGHHSEAYLLGLFQVSVLHNVVHLLFGAVGLLAASRPRWAVGYLVGGGLVYLALWIYGLAVDQSHDANVVPLNDADNWLHLGLGVGMVALGVAGYRWWRGGIGGDAVL
ncbi:putative membrane protein YiaA [Nocardioides zeae]|uniref:Membrane protein YiaA n=1 Tax=Nocardioides zeae TaxID=1457234 RepID=A0ACC6IFW0_9ACTN|nr:DUF4383 domain-containing protein [Nocardioides zeae]MDR6176379.1 putative membrane protein YiaA [Nocardioides zeae]MDR6209392.1 putative membrane protein YiaA [Nocardioides zeae]